MRVNFHSRAPCLTFADLRTAAISTLDRSNLINIDEEVDLGWSGTLHSADIDFLLEYKIFPSTIMDFVTEWVVCHRPMRTGDVIIQRAFIPPIGVGLCLEFGVRIIQIYNEENCRGFAHESLRGHPEAGVSKFCFKKTNHSAKFRIKTESSPGNALSGVIAGIFTHRYQRWCTSHALKNVKSKFTQKNPASTPPRLAGRIGYLHAMTKKQSPPEAHKTADKKDSVESLVDYFSWRHPYCGDESKAREAAVWALNQASKSPEVIAVLLLEAINERNSLRKSLQAIGIISTNQSFVESATRESVEWAFGGKLKPSPQKKTDRVKLKAR